MARRQGMVRVGSFGEVTHGITGIKRWFKYKFRRWAWGIVGSTVLAIAITSMLAFAQWKFADLTSPGTAIFGTRALLSLSQLAVIGFIAILLWGMHSGSQAVMPTFDAKIERFEPRPPPNFEAGETWDQWLRKGIRIGRWQEKPGSMEPGKIAWMRIIDVHPLIAAESRWGKSTVLWALLWELKPAIDAGVVEIIMFDPKNGMEMAPAVKLGLIKSKEPFGRKDEVDEVEHFFYGQDVGHPDPNNPEKWIGKRYEETFVVPLELHVQQMRQRAGEIRGNAQFVTASTKTPWRFVIVDEGASLARPGSKPDVKQRIIGAMLSLEDQGAGAGYTVVVATQHPDMKKIPFRHGLIGSGLCGLVKTWDAVDMVLGRGSYARGAWGDQLNPAVPGVFFMERHGAWQLRIQDAKPTFKRKPPDRGGGKEIENTEEPDNAELATVTPLRPQLKEQWPRQHEHVGGEQVGA